MCNETYDKIIRLANFTFALLDSLVLKAQPTKGHFLRVLDGEHLGMILDGKGIF